MPANLTAADLDAIEARVSRALPAPWTWWKPSLWIALQSPSEDVITTTVNGLWVYSRDDAEFIARAREDVPALLSALRAAQAERDAAWTSADNLEGENHRLASEYAALFTALNDAAMEVDAVHFWGTRLIESIPAYLREAGKRLAGLERQRDEARGLVDAFIEAEPRVDFYCFWCGANILFDNAPHAPDCAWDAARKARDAWGGGDE